MAVKRLRVVGAGVLAAAMAACSAPSPDPPGTILRVPFACSNGERIEMAFDNSLGTATLMRGGRSLVLPQQRSGSGFIYGNGQATVRGKANDLTVELAGQPPLQCKAP